MGGRSDQRQEVRTGAGGWECRMRGSGWLLRGNRPWFCARVPEPGRGRRVVSL